MQSATCQIFEASVHRKPFLPLQITAFQPNPPNLAILVRPQAQILWPWRKRLWFPASDVSGSGVQRFEPSVKYHQNPRGKTPQKTRSNPQKRGQTPKNEVKPTGAAAAAQSSAVGEGSRDLEPRAGAGGCGCPVTFAGVGLGAEHEALGAGAGVAAGGVPAQPVVTQQPVDAALVHVWGHTRHPSAALGWEGLICPAPSQEGAMGWLIQLCTGTPTIPEHCPSAPGALAVPIPFGNSVPATLGGRAFP